MNNLSEFAKLIAEGKAAKKREEENKKKNFFEKYNIEKTEITPFDFIGELVKLKKESETPVEEIVEEVIPVEPPKTADELLSELAALIQEGKKANGVVFEEQKEDIESFVGEIVQEIVELKEEEVKQEEIKEQPIEKDLVAQAAESITKVAENTNLFSTPEPDKVSPNFKAIQAKLKSLEQWVAKISTAGPGSGSYWLNDLGDTEKSSLQNATDGQVLTFNASIGKWTAQDSQGGAGTNDSVARTLAQASFDKANTVSSNTVIIQGVDNTQNTNIQSAWDKANNALANTSGTFAGSLIIDSTTSGDAFTIRAEPFLPVGKQTWKFSTVTGLGPPFASYMTWPDNTIQLTAFTGTAIDQTPRDTANLASSNTVITQGVDITQNNRMTIIENTDVSQNVRLNYSNSAITIIQGVDNTQNTNITNTNTKAQNAYDQANTAYSSALNAYGAGTTAYLWAQQAYDQANTGTVLAQGAFNKANTAITTSGGQTINGSLTANGATAFIAGSAANSGVALQMPNEGALRNMTNGQNTMYFDVSNGGTTHGSFRFRSSSNFTELLDISTDGLRAISAYKGKTPFNSALDTVVTVDNIKYRISNQGGVFPQIASASGSTVDVCYDVEGVVNGVTNPTYTNNSGYILLADGTWLSIYSTHGMDARGDRLTAHITDKNAGKIYRATFIKTNNSSNTDGYNIIVERII